jgi:hypothetical protein
MIAKRKYQSGQRQGQKMAEEAIKKRLRTAKFAAMSFLRKKGWEVVYCSDHRVDLVAIKKRTFKFIKICIDKIDVEDREKVRSFAPDFESREIKRQVWLKIRGKRKFKIQNYLFYVNGKCPHLLLKKKRKIGFSKNPCSILKA